jgi:2'-5' RNA ligase
MARTPSTVGPCESAAPLRTFFALWPDPAARDALAALARDTAVRLQGRAPAAGNLHVTLAFVGDVAAPRLPVLRAVGLAAASGARAFTLTLDRIGAFRGTGIAWAGASTAPAELERLVASLASALADAGFPTERRAFRPHVTLARHCLVSVSAALEAPVAWSVARVALNASETLPGGPRYRELAAWPFGLQAPAGGVA